MAQTVDRAHEVHKNMGLDEFHFLIDTRFSE